MSNLVVDTINSRSGATPVEILGAGMSYNGQLFSQVDVVNVKTYGAKGDGVTDDTAAIQSAINTGKTVVVPKGSSFYKLTSALVMNTPYQKIYSTGQAQLRQQSTNLNVIEILSTADVTVEGLHLWAAGTKTTQENGAGILCNNSYRVNIRDCIFQNHLGAGVAIVGGDSNQVVRNQFLSSPAVDGATTNQTSADVLILGSTQNTVSNNTMLSGQAFGVSIEAVQPSHVCDDNIIRNNVIKNARGSGIQVFRSDEILPINQSLRRIKIVENRIESTKGSIFSSVTGLYSYGQAIFLAGAEYAEVRDNLIRFTHTSYASFSVLPSGAIEANYLTNIKILNNIVTDSYSIGISIIDTGLGETTGEVIISNNSIERTSLQSIEVLGIDNIFAENNKIADCGIGIYIVGNSAINGIAKIVDNKIVRTTGVGGIVLSNIKTGVVTRNIVDDVNVYGVHITTVPHLTVNNNQILGAKITGILLSSSCTNTILTNNFVDGNSFSSAVGFNLGIACVGGGNMAVGCTTPRMGLATVASTI